MHSYSLEHVASNVLLRDLHALAATDRSTTALLLAHIGEVKERKLFAPAGQPYMHAYCVNVLSMSEDIASKRLQAAGAARRFPVIFEALADGRLHLTGVCMLAPHLLPENAEALLAGAMGKTKAGIEKLLAEHFPQADLQERLQVIPAATSGRQVVAILESPSDPGQMEGAAAPASVSPMPSDPDQMVNSPTPASPTPPPQPEQEFSRLKPLAPQRYALQATVDEETHDLLREAQDLLAHTETGREIPNVLKRALQLLVRQLKQRKFAETERPRRASLKPKSERTIPAAVKRAVKARDEGRCTFVNEKGECCPARSGLEYDHAKPVAQGGETTVENIRLRCRAHNQLTAEQAFGAGFMQEKRAAAQSSKAKRSAPVQRETPKAEPAVQAAIHEKAFEVIPWLREHSSPAPGTP